MIESISRQGYHVSYPLMSLSIGITCIGPHNTKNVLEVIDTCSVLKNEAKKHQGSNYLVDRRTENI